MEKWSLWNIDVNEQCVILKLDFTFDMGYMFNECFVAEGNLVFINHVPDESTDYIYVYGLNEKMLQTRIYRTHCSK